MLWLPTFASEHLKFNESQKTIVAILYDVGTISGSIILGLISDIMYSRRCPISFLGLLVATIGHSYLIFITEDDVILLYFLIFFLGFLVGGVSNIIAGTACADIGKKNSLSENSKVLCTVVGIVDGTGSIGAAIGQQGIGYLQENRSWKDVFILMTVFVFLSSIPLL